MEVSLFLIIRFRVRIVSLEPPVLDTIHIESPLNVTSTVQFVLSSGDNNPAQFVARFSHDSASEFNVYPKKGILEPAKKYIFDNLPS